MVAFVDRRFVAARDTNAKHEYTSDTQPHITATAYAAYIDHVVATDRVYAYIISRQNLPKVVPSIIRLWFWHGNTWAVVQFRNRYKSFCQCYVMYIYRHICACCLRSVRVLMVLSIYFYSYTNVLECGLVIYVISLAGDYVVCGVPVRINCFFTISNTVKTRLLSVIVFFIKSLKRVIATFIRFRFKYVNDTCIKRCNLSTFYVGTSFSLCLCVN